MNANEKMRVAGPATRVGVCPEPDPVLSTPRLLCMVADALDTIDATPFNEVIVLRELAVMSRLISAHGFNTVENIVSAGGLDRLYSILSLLPSSEAVHLAVYEVLRFVPSTLCQAAFGNACLHWLPFYSSPKLAFSAYFFLHRSFAAVVTLPPGLPGSSRVVGMICTTVEATLTRFADHPRVLAEAVGALAEAVAAFARTSQLTNSDRSLITESLLDRIKAAVARAEACTASLDAAGPGGFYACPVDGWYDDAITPGFHAIGDSVHSNVAFERDPHFAAASAHVSDAGRLAGAALRLCLASGRFPPGYADAATAPARRASAFRLVAAGLLAAIRNPCHAAGVVAGTPWQQYALAADIEAFSAPAVLFGPACGAPTEALADSLRLLAAMSESPRVFQRMSLHGANLLSALDAVAAAPPSPATFSVAESLLIVFARFYTVDWAAKPVQSKFASSLAFFPPLVAILSGHGRLCGNVLVAVLRALRYFICFSCDSSKKCAAVDRERFLSALEVVAARRPRVPHLRVALAQLCSQVKALSSVFHASADAAVRAARVYVRLLRDEFDPCEYLFYSTCSQGVVDKDVRGTVAFTPAFDAAGGPDALCAYIEAVWRAGGMPKSLVDFVCDSPPAFADQLRTPRLLELRADMLLADPASVLGGTSSAGSLAWVLAGDASFPVRVRAASDAVRAAQAAYAAGSETADTAAALLAFWRTFSTLVAIIWNSDRLMSARLGPALEVSIEALAFVVSLPDGFADTLCSAAGRLALAVLSLPTKEMTKGCSVPASVGPRVAALAAPLLRALHRWSFPQPLTATVLSTILPHFRTHIVADPGALNVWEAAAGFLPPTFLRPYVCKFMCDALKTASKLPAFAEIAERCAHALAPAVRVRSCSYPSASVNVSDDPRHTDWQLVSSDTDLFMVAAEVVAQPVAAAVLAEAGLLRHIILPTLEHCANAACSAGLDRTLASAIEYSLSALVNLHTKVFTMGSTEHVGRICEGLKEVMKKRGLDRKHPNIYTLTVRMCGVIAVVRAAIVYRAPARLTSASRFRTAESCCAYVDKLRTQTGAALAQTLTEIPRIAAGDASDADMLVQCGALRRMASIHMPDRAPLYAAAASLLARGACDTDDGVDALTLFNDHDEVPAVLACDVALSALRRGPGNKIMNLRAMHLVGVRAVAAPSHRLWRSAAWADTTVALTATPENYFGRKALDVCFCVEPPVLLALLQNKRLETLLERVPYTAVCVRMEHGTPLAELWLGLFKGLVETILRLSRMSPAAADIVLGAGAIETLLRAGVSELASLCTSSIIEVLVDALDALTVASAPGLRRFIRAGGLCFLDACAAGPNSQRALLSTTRILAQCRKVAGPTAFFAAHNGLRICVNVWRRASPRTAQDAHGHIVRCIHAASLLPGIPAVAEVFAQESWVGLRALELSAPPFANEALGLVSNLTFAPRSLMALRKDPIEQRLLARFAGANYIRCLRLKAIIMCSAHVSRPFKGCPGVMQAALELGNFAIVPLDHLAGITPSRARLNRIDVASDTDVSGPLFALLTDAQQQAHSPLGATRLIFLCTVFGIARASIALHGQLAGQPSFFALCADRGAGSAEVAAATAWMCRQFLRNGEWARRTLQHVGAPAALARLQAVHSRAPGLRYALQAARDALLTGLDAAADAGVSAGAPVRGLALGSVSALREGALLSEHSGPNPGRRCFIFVTQDLAWLVCKDPRARTADGERRIRVSSLAAAEPLGPGGARFALRFCARLGAPALELEAPILGVRDRWVHALAALISI